MQPYCLAVIGRVVIHISHHNRLDSRITFLHNAAVLVDDLSSAGAQVLTLASYTGRKVGYINSKMLTIDKSVNHKYIPGAEIILGLLVKGDLYFGIIEVERNALAVKIGKLLWLVKQGHVHASAVRSVIMHDLIVGICYLRVRNEVLKHETVFYLADSQNGMITPIVIFHCLDDLCHIGNLLLVLRLGPLVLAFRKELFIVFCRVVIYVEEVLKIVEPYHIIAGRALLSGTSDAGEHKQQSRQYDS